MTTGSKKITHRTTICTPAWPGVVDLQLREGVFVRSCSVLCSKFQYFCTKLNIAVLTQDFTPKFASSASPCYDGHFGVRSDPVCVFFLIRASGPYCAPASIFIPRAEICCVFPYLRVCKSQRYRISVGLRSRFSQALRLPRSLNFRCVCLCPFSLVYLYLAVRGVASSAHCRRPKPKP